MRTQEFRKPYLPAGHQNYRRFVDLVLGQQVLSMSWGQEAAEKIFPLLLEYEGVCRELCVRDRHAGYSPRLNMSTAEWNDYFSRCHAIDRELRAERDALYEQIVALLKEVTV